jgi:hypothetical protein
MAANNPFDIARGVIESLRNKTQSSSLAKGYAKLAAQPVPKVLQPVANAGSQFNTRLNNTVSYFKQNPQELNVYSPQNIAARKTGISPLDEAAKFTGNYLSNNYIVPVARAPLNIKTIADPRVKMSDKFGPALQLAQAVLSVAPDPFQDTIFPAFNYLKGARANSLSTGGGYSVNNVKAGLAAASGETPIGLGDALSTNKLEQSLGNLAEIPFMLAAGKLSAKKIESLKQIKNIIPNIDTASSVIRETLMTIDNNLATAGRSKYVTPIKPNDLSMIEDLVSKIFPGILKEKELKYLKTKDLPSYLSVIDGYLRDAKTAALNPEINLGLKIKAVGQGEKRLAQATGKLPQLAEQTTDTLGQKGLLRQGQSVTGVGPSNGTSIGTQEPIIDPVQKIINALKVAKPLQKEQEAIYSAIRSKQAGALSGIGTQMGGESGYYKKLGQLKGEMPKVQFESIRKSVTQSDINELFNRVEKSNLDVFGKVNAQGALRKLLGESGGSVPTNSELKLLNEVFPPELIQTILNNRSGFQKAISLAEGVLNLPRAVMATADLSAPLRQGIFLVGRPKQWIPAFKNMFKYAFSESAYQGLADSIKSRPTYKLMRQAKLAITDNSPILGSREEEFMSTLPEKIPVFGQIAKGSNRAYSGFLNKLRADTFDELVKGAKSQGVELTDKVVRDIGSFINAATGRGELPKLIERAAPALNAAFFSPRLMASRVNLLNPAYYAKLDPYVRKEALKSLLGFAGTAGTVLGLAKLGGAEVSTDPRSADFGKIKVGNTRYDVLGGFQQYIRLASQLASGQIVSSTTGKLITLGEGYKPLTRKDILLRFFENKTSPVASFITGLLTGTNSIGDQFSVPDEIINRFIPMMAQDIYDLQKEYGPQGIAMAIPGIFGAGSQTYGNQELVTGKNQLGKPTMELRSPQGLNEVISSKLFGEKPLRPSAQYSADAYLKQLEAMPREEARKTFDLIIQQNPELAKKINQSRKNKKLGITPNDETLKSKGVASGDRAIALSKQFNKLKTREEKIKLWSEYVKKGVITKEVAKQLKELLNK